MYKKDYYEVQKLELTRSGAEERIFTVLNRHYEREPDTSLCEIAYEIAQKLGFK